MLLYIALFLFGALMGNFASSLLYRLPRQMKVFSLDKESRMPPMCSYCAHELRFYEFLPILSWIFSRQKCNYCGVKINYMYTALEVFGAVISVFLYYKLQNFSEYFVLLVCCILLLLKCFLYISTHVVYSSVSYSIVIFAMIYRVLLDANILHTVLFFSISVIALIMCIKIKFIQSQDSDILLPIFTYTTLLCGISALLPLIWPISKLYKDKRLYCIMILTFYTLLGILL